MASVEAASERAAEFIPAVNRRDKPGGSLLLNLGHAFADALQGCGGFLR